MSEWWTYRLVRFPDVLAQDLLAPGRALSTRGLAPAIAGAGRRRGLALAGGCAAARGRRAAFCAVLALAWLWVGWAFHWQRYATINWARALFRGGLRGAGGAAARARGLPCRRPGTRAARRPARDRAWCWRPAASWCIPWPASLAGRPWTQAEVFGLMPEPTALATLGLLLAAGPARRGWLIVIPLLSFALGMVTLWLISG